MEDVVYTLPEEARDAQVRERNTRFAANAADLVERGEDPEGTPMWFKNKHLPLADKSSGVVRFRSVTPKQSFVRGPEQSVEDIREEILAAAWRHRELAADHIAAALWISISAPIVDAPALRVKKTKTSRVVLPLDHQHVTPKDFQVALLAAGKQEGVQPTNPVYIGAAGATGDGRTTHEFEVTYVWTEKA